MALESMKYEMESGVFEAFVSVDEDELKNALGLEIDNDGNFYDPLAKDLDNDGVSDRYDHDFRDGDYLGTTYDVDDNAQLKQEMTEKPSILKQIKSYQETEISFIRIVLLVVKKAIFQKSLNKVIL